MSESAGHRLLRRADYLSTPWRNGGGTTLEILRAAAGAAASEDAPFEWRLSLASIAQSGPFSSYPGYSRCVTLIEGRGFQLDIAHRRVVLAEIGSTALFPGEADTRCTLLEGPCLDLSLMVCAPGEILAARTLSISGRRQVALEARALNALFCMAGGPLLVDEETLQRHDTLLVAPGCPAVRLATEAANPTGLLLLTWRLAGDQAH